MKKTMILPVQLTTEEKLQKGILLADCEDRITFLETEKKQTADAYKAKIEGIEAERYYLAKTLKSGTEDREIEVDEVKCYETKWIIIYRRDTGEEVNKRLMNIDEMQDPLFDEDESQELTAELPENSEEPSETVPEPQVELPEKTDDQNVKPARTGKILNLVAPINENGKVYIDSDQTQSALLQEQSPY
jgi:hypothetical protein